MLLERTIQWMFQKSKILATRRDSAQSGSYLELVVSASKTLVEKSRAEIIEMAVRELGEFFPAAREAKLIKATVIKEVHATFSPTPGSDAFRPSHVSPWPTAFPCGRLDGDRMALNHGGRGAQRLWRGGSAERQEVSRARFAGEGIDAAVWVKKRTAWLPVLTARADTSRWNAGPAWCRIGAYLRQARTM